MVAADDDGLHPLPDWAVSLAEAATSAGEDVRCALEIALDAGRVLPAPGRGQTALRWAVLAALARANVTVARVVEAHADALAILAESGVQRPPDGTWGVFAAEAPGHKLTAKATADGGWELSGDKPWCSLGDVLDAALVTAHTDAGHRLFRVALRQPGVQARPAGEWVARGLRTVTSVGIGFDRVPAEPVGAVDWYLDRPGFAWGGIGVAACWHGGALGLADTLRERASGDLAALHVGVVDAALHASAAVLRDAARAVDDSPGDGALLALRARAVVADAVERVLREVAHALGPAPLAFDARHAARVADLELYLRQHHAERDLATLGVTVLGEGGR